MSGKDIIERLRNPKMVGQFGEFGLDLASAERDRLDAADMIAALRYDHARDVEKLAEQVKSICELRKHAEEQTRRIERLCGAVTDGPTYRETVKDLPRRWPEVGTHE